MISSHSPSTNKHIFRVPFPMRFPKTFWGTTPHGRHGRHGAPPAPVHLLRPSLQGLAALVVPAAQPRTLGRRRWRDGDGSRLGWKMVSSPPWAIELMKHKLEAINQDPTIKNGEVSVKNLRF